MMGIIPAWPRPQFKRSILPVLAAAFLVSSVVPAGAVAAGQRVEKKFSVTGRPVVVIHNVAN
jgi:hypothetical protein